MSQGPSNLESPAPSNPLAGGNGLRQALGERLLDALAEIAELKAELRVSLQAIHDRLDQLDAIERQLALHDRQITRLRTLWTTVAAAVGFVAASVKDWLFDKP